MIQWDFIVIQWDINGNGIYPLVICYSSLLKMAIEIVDLPIQQGDFPWFFVCLPEGSLLFVMSYPP
jgi:hypothetical protein